MQQSCLQTLLPGLTLLAGEVLRILQAVLPAIQRQDQGHHCQGQSTKLQELCVPLPRRQPGDGLADDMPVGGGKACCAGSVLHRASGALRSHKELSQHALALHCLIAMSLCSTVAALYSAQVKELEAMFFKGQLDSTLQDKCQALDPSFAFDDLRFLREEILSSALEPSISGGSGDLPERIAQVARQRLLADFALLEAELASEQVIWQTYLAKLSEVEDADLSVRIALKEKQHDALTRAVAEHLEASYRTICIPQWTGVSAYLEGALSAFAGQAPVRMPEQLWRINIVNTCCLGVQASLVLPHLAPILSADHAYFPEKTLTIVILPNTPEWGLQPE